MPHRFLCVLLLATAVARAAAAELTLAIAPRWGRGEMAVPSAAERNAAGQALRVTRLAALLSNASLLRADGSIVRLEGQYGFIDAERSRLGWTLRGVPAGDYAGIEFELGLPAGINHADPARWPAGHALNPLTNALHWGWQGGYVFLALEGKWNAPGGERGFSYHLATDARRMTVRFIARYRVAKHATIDLAFDLARVLAGHRLAPDDGSESTHSAEDDELAPCLAHAVERAWFWLGARETTAPAEERAPDAAGNAAYSLATPYAFVVPAGFPQPSLPADNLPTQEGVELGAALFSDPRLSGNGRQSCASCHDPKRAFSDTVASSPGAEGRRGRRNSMPLVNLAWSPDFAWDGGQARIRDQARAAWTSPVEMYADPERVLAILRGDAASRARFRAAFGSEEITEARVTLALEQYLLTVVSADSRFDRALRGEGKLSEEEQRGFELFAMEYDPARGRRGGDCFHCHGGPLFTDFAVKNTGLDLAGADAGRAEVTGRAGDRGKFKTPSLRNVAVTGPYMHDGRFRTLEEVVAHYDHGVRRSPGLDPNLAKHPAEGLALSTADRRALVAFLRALTDPRFTPGGKVLEEVHRPEDSKQ